MIKYNPTGTIETDQEAEELILQIREHEVERKRLKDVCQKQIDKYMDKMAEIDATFDEESKIPLIMLGEFSKAKANKITKTQKSYALPSGTLMWKKRNPEYKRNESSLIKWAEIYVKKYVKVVSTKKLDWAGMKKDVVLDDDNKLLGILTEDGELVEPDGLEVIPVEDTFEIV